MKKIRLDLDGGGYDIFVGSSILTEATNLFNLNRKVLVVTDSGVPTEYSSRIASACRDAKIITVPMGEGAKSLAVLERVLRTMSDMEMTRQDCLIAVGGGVVGDLTGFAAACYMRGIDFYNVPTTLLSQVDSSIGGKTAINFNGIKNIVGAFHQPKGVLIDTDVLSTLPERHKANGLCEAIKMAVCCDADLFEKLEKYTKKEIYENIEEIIIASLSIKKSVVEQDEKEKGQRKILNFGHTFGHGVEAEGEMHGLLHGECVSIGMLPMCENTVRKRLISVLEKVGLPTEYTGNINIALEYVAHDKKRSGGQIDYIYVESVGTPEIRRCDISKFGDLIRVRL